MKLKSYLIITAICISTMLVIKKNEFNINLAVFGEELNVETLSGVDYIQSSLLDSFDDAGLKVYNVDDNEMRSLCKLDNSITRLGSFHKDNCILLNTSNEKYEDTVVIHEFGHYLDTIEGNISCSEKFEQLYIEEGDLGTEYGSSSSVEYFAESFTAYLVHKNNIISSYDYEGMYNNCSETMNFIENLLVDYE